jgi:hypothetical protein
MDDLPLHKISFESADLTNPLDWLQRQSYGQLKDWLRQALWHGRFLPVMIPSENAPAISYLAQLLLRSNTEVKTSLRTIIPELLREWNLNDTADCLLNILFLCGNLSCSEAEPIVAGIITEKLSERPEHIKCRKEGLGVLQTIGTSRTLHLFKRYIDNLDYAPFCYRGLYLNNLSNAGIELPRLMALYRAHQRDQDLKTILHFLFIGSLKPPEYMTVIMAFVDHAPEEYFIEFFELLKSLKILNERFMSSLSTVETTRFLNQIIARTRLEDSTEMVELLKQLGIELEPPAAPYNPEPEAKAVRPTGKLVPMGEGRYFHYKVHYARQERVRLKPKTPLGSQRVWAFSRDFNPPDLNTMFEDIG